jgi:hypothetical protein
MPPQETEQYQLVFSFLKDEADVFRFWADSKSVIEAMAPAAVIAEQAPELATGVCVDSSDMLVVASGGDLASRLGLSDADRKNANLVCGSDQTQSFGHLIYRADWR